MRDLTVTTAASMSSREIADLVGSRHDKVKQSIERLASIQRNDDGSVKREAVIVQPPMGDEQSTDAMGRTRTTRVYLFTGAQGKRDSLVVVAQLCPEFTARLVDRWQELEAQQVPAIPKTYAAALLEAGRLAQINEEQAAKLAEAAPKVEYVDRYVEATSGSKGFRQVCKLLGAKEPEFRQFLSDKKIMYRLGGEWMPFAYHVEAGRFEVKTGVANDHAYNTAKFTAKGVTWVAGEWAKHQVEALV